MEAPIRENGAVAPVSKLTAEQGARAVRMVLKATPESPTRSPAITSVAEKIGVYGSTRYALSGY